jgi:hypothetical protein
VQCDSQISSLVHYTHQCPHYQSTSWKRF